MKKVLVISNGHGEDLNGSLIAEALRDIDPSLQVDAFPIVGQGKSYLSKGFTVVVPTLTMPSGGMFYLNTFNFIKDLWAGLIGLTLRQILTLFKVRNQYDIFVGVGDILPLLLCFLIRRKFYIFLVAYTSYYSDKGKLGLPLFSRFLLNSSLCLGVLTKDNYTAKDLQRQGIKKVSCHGYPIMDALKHNSDRLSCDYGGNPITNDSNALMVALLPGSRVPEALRNLELQIQVCERLVALSSQSWRFCGALVNDIIHNDIAVIAKNLGWNFYFANEFKNVEKNDYISLRNKPEKFILIKQIKGKDVVIELFYHTFAEILVKSDVILGMAGTAVEQGVGLGKPVVQIIGQGPQFTYRFAEAQMRYLGINVRTVNEFQDLDLMFSQGAREIMEMVEDSQYLMDCRENGLERIGSAGASRAIAHSIISSIG
ncbi:MAG: lipid-A-disaccharide synthase-related protein [Cyanobacterium sp.]